MLIPAAKTGNFKFSKSLLKFGSTDILSFFRIFIIPVIYFCDCIRKKSACLSVSSSVGQKGKKSIEWVICKDMIGWCWFY